MNQAAPADRRWKKESNLSLCESKRGSLMGKKPRHQEDHQQEQRPDGFIKHQVRSGMGPEIVRAALRLEQKAPKVEIKIKRACDPAQEIFGLL